ncbi:hypothetical protein IKO50_05510, partial [bacterium]|nr:hypothetical protein [bacterium]
MIEQLVIGCGLGEITITSVKSTEEIKCTKDEDTDIAKNSTEESELANGTETQKTNGTETEESDLVNGTETEKTDITIEISTDDTTEEIISPEETEKKLDVTLSSRQINQFIFNPTSHFITFYFFGITQPITASYQIIKELYLILSGGVMDNTLSKTICTLDQAVDSEGKQDQADFSCKISDLDETKTYVYFELYDSEFIVGIPDDEVLLNPVKTQEAIEAGNLTDYSLEENKNKLPTYFEVESINGAVPEEGEFTITGTVDQEITEENKFTLELTYSGNYKTECTIPKASAGKIEIICVFSQSISAYVMIEQQIIRDGLEEIFTITSIKSNEELKWVTESTDTTVESSDTTEESSDTTVESSDTTVESSDTTVESSDTTVESSDTTV